MTFRGRWPWLASAGLHLAGGALGVILFLVQSPPTAPVLRMRLISSGGVGVVPGNAPESPLSPPSPLKTPLQTEPALPSWHGTPPVLAGNPAIVPTPVSLEELIGPIPDKPQTEESPATSGIDSGWSGPGGMGYSPPPLPTPGLTPPQGAQWKLVLSVPGGGGFVRSFEGLDSGHPELDRWLEEYLRTVSFPSSPDGQDYNVRWILHLESGRPR